MRTEYTITTYTVPQRIDSFRLRKSSICWELRKWGVGDDPRTAEVRRYQGSKTRTSAVTALREFVSQQPEERGTAKRAQVI